MSAESDGEVVTSVELIQSIEDFGDDEDENLGRPYPLKVTFTVVSGERTELVVHTQDRGFDVFTSNLKVRDWRDRR